MNILHQQTIASLSALILLTAFLLLIVKSPRRLVIIYAGQSLLLASATLFEALITTRHELYFSAILTIVLKVIMIPWLLRYLIRKLDISRINPVIVQQNFFLLIGAAALVLFCYHIISPITLFTSIATKNIVVVALSVILFGMLMMLVRREALTHVIGFMVMENGLFFAALMAMQGMPMVVELGIAFDVLVAAVLFSVLFFHIRSNIDSLDIDYLNRLREDRE